ncbi:9917_t:CDS:1, partial [Dentiscutata erythropus]
AEFRFRHPSQFRLACGITLLEPPSLQSADGNSTAQQTFDSH